MTEWMIEQGFIQSKNDPCLYHKPAKLERVQLAQTDKIQELVAKGYMQSTCKRDSTRAVLLSWYGCVHTCG